MGIHSPIESWNTATELHGVCNYESVDVCVLILEYTVLGFEYISVRDLPEGISLGLTLIQL